MGKSSVTIQFVDGHFVDSYNPTIENTFQKVITVKGEDFDTQIVDTAGQDDYSIFQSRFYMGVHGYVLVYSVNSRTSLEMCRVLNEKIINAHGTENVPRVLAGNKSDLVYDRQITTEEGRKLAEEWGCVFIECSAKHNDNIGAEVGRGFRDDGWADQTWGGADKQRVCSICS